MIASILTFAGCALVFWALLFAAYRRWLSGRREASYLHNVLSRRAERDAQQLVPFDGLRHWQTRGDRRLLTTADTRRHVAARRDSR